LVSLNFFSFSKGKKKGELEGEFLTIKLKKKESRRR